MKNVFVILLGMVAVNAHADCNLQWSMNGSDTGFERAIMSALQDKGWKITSEAAPAQMKMDVVSKEPKFSGLFTKEASYFLSGEFTLNGKSVEIYAQAKGRWLPGSPGECGTPLYQQPYGRVMKRMMSEIESKIPDCQ